jgi:hypothetical protein
VTKKITQWVFQTASVQLGGAMRGGDQQMLGGEVSLL